MRPENPIIDSLVNDTTSDGAPSTTGDFVLKGRRWLLHDRRQESRYPATGHLIHWHGERIAVSVCGIEYHLTGSSPHGSTPQFICFETGVRQIANTVLRMPLAVQRLCPTCRQELGRLAGRGLVLPYAQESFHPATRQRREVNHAAS